MSQPSDSNIPAAPATDASSPQDRLASSRNALVWHMTRNNSTARANLLNQVDSDNQHSNNNTDTGFDSGQSGESRHTDNSHSENTTRNTGSSASPKQKSRSSDSFGLVRHALMAWWQNHPAHLAVDIARPLLSEYARHKPVQLLAISAGLGAIAVLIKPWRMVTTAGILLGTLKSSGFSNSLLSLLSIFSRK